MTDSERVRCPICNAVVKPSAIRTVDADVGEWEETLPASEDGLAGPVYTRIVRMQTIGCDLCTGSTVN